MADEADSRLLAAAIRLGASALGTTWPNPAVGAIVVKEGRVLGRGRTAPGGRPHAEPQALAEAGEAARGATLYVSLEPCSHQGRAGPCADAIIAAGISRVVAAIPDPDPRVAGQGFAKLRAAGIEVVAGLLAKDALRAHAGHLKRTEWPVPYVTLKLALSADGAIGLRSKGNVRITGDQARRHVHALRSRYDAILVGRGTIELDDPELTCRLPGLEKRSPVRVILDTEAKLGDGYRVIREGVSPTWIISATTGHEGPPHVRRFREPKSTLGGLDTWSCMYRLKSEGISRVMVEGGAHVARSFLEADIIDEVLLFHSSIRLGVDGIPALAGWPLSSIEASEHFRRAERRMFGDNRMTRYERMR